MVIRRPLSALAGGNVCSIAAGQQQNGPWLFLRLSRFARRVGALSASSLAERAPTPTLPLKGRERERAVRAVPLLTAPLPLWNVQPSADRLHRPAPRITPCPNQLPAPGSPRSSASARSAAARSRWPRAAKAISISI